ncbi:MAG: MarR family winged helix-turn-helix transcriptional regulator [Halieaceae bacterium]|nr:MarR family winged helix-turn-helix transcriptional regulator [Halieaceae bacterium]
MRAQHPADAGQDAIDLEHFLPYRLSRLTNTVSNAIAALYRDRFGLSIPDWRVLAVLARFPGSSAQDLVSRTRMDKVAVSRSVARLVERGMVNRATDEKDRRLSRLALSAEGSSVYARIVPMARDCEAALLEDLEPKQREALDRLLTMLQAAADELDGTNEK